MFTSTQEAMATLRSTSGEPYRLACEYLVANRGQLKQRIFINLPGGLRGNDDSDWNTVKAGSKERCSCGNERVILPLNPRTEYITSAKPVVISAENPVYLKPVGGDKESTFVRLTIEEDVLTFVMDPFSPFVFTADIFSKKGFQVAQLAEVVAKHPEQPPVMFNKYDGIPTPLFAITAVDEANQTVTITPDSAVEAFDPDLAPPHQCN